MPGRLDASYVDEAGDKVPPVLLHRAILGSFERFIGILLEHHAGNLPLWLAPTQAVVMNITDQQSEYAEKVAGLLKNQGFRVNLDLRNEKIGYKIRQHTLSKANLHIVVGNQEMENSQVSVRSRDGKDLGVMSVDDLIGMMHQSIDDKQAT